MSFVNPFGLLGLIAVPVLIVIYIIKNKYTETTVSSTYLWTLSERFLKKRNPLNRLNGLLSLILQVLAVVCISFAVAKPVFTLKGAANDYVFVLDASASMQFEGEGGTRFEQGKSEIKGLIENSANGSSYTLVCEGETTDRIFENITDKRLALTMLAEVENSCSSASVSTVNAHGVAQQYFTANTASLVYLVTDKSYQTANNVTLVNVASEKENYSVSDVAYSRIAGDKLRVTGNVWSYASDANLTVSLYLDDGTTPAVSKSYPVTKLQATPVEFEVLQTEFDSVKLVVENSDGLSADNESIVYNLKSDSGYKTLVVTDGSPLFWKAAISAIGNINVEVMTTAEYEQTEESYGLYVFDSYTPSTLPRDAAVWFLNPQPDLNNLSAVGFTVSEQVDFGNDLQADSVDSWEMLNYNQSTATTVQALLANTNEDEISLAAYRRIETVRDFHELLYCQNDPVLFAGTNAYGNRQVVFAFDVHDSDFPVTHDFSVITYNLLNYTFPELIEKTAYYSGESMKINVLSSVTSIRIEAPSGKITYPNVNTDVIDYKITEAGIYSVTFISGQTERKINVYGNIPLVERLPSVAEEDFSLRGEASTERRDGIYDDLLLWFIILAVVFIADWTVYCYEQYQLR